MLLFYKRKLFLNINAEFSIFNAKSQGKVSMQQHSEFQLSFIVTEPVVMMLTIFNINKGILMRFLFRN